MSNKLRNNYPLEFKISSAQLAVDSDQTITQTARDLGINHNTLHDCIVKYSDSDQKNMNRKSLKSA
ncbi:MAG: transposase [Rickettsiales bacterium]|jgi:transposase